MFESNGKNFAFYLVIKGRQLDIYNYWSHVRERIENISNLIYKSYYAFHEAIEKVRNYLGPTNYFF